MVRMAGNNFAAALLYALIVIEALVWRPIQLSSALSIPSSPSQGSYDSLSTASFAASSQYYSSPLSSSEQQTSLSSLSTLLGEVEAEANGQQQKQQQQSQETSKNNNNNSKNRVNSNSSGNGSGAKHKQLCKISEWKCSNSTCISLSKFCDGTADCADGSDEPIHCNVCNRTWFGDTGKTYEIEIDKPKVLPFVCHLNFTAVGGSHGDIIQINIDKFNVGRFTSHTKDGCPDGYMTISEQKFSVPSAATAADPMMFNDDESGNADSMDGNGIAKSRRNGNGGKWCGSAWGYNVYYSESSSINVTVKLFKFAQQQQLGSSASNNNFSFRLTYKFLKRTDAKLRNEKGIWTGDHVPGTYCNKNVYDCDRRVCRIRSPNFPGMYPRNLTCVYHIHHRPPPSGLHAMLVIRQPIGQKMYLKDQQQERHHESNGRSLRAWNHCDTVQDYLSIYDGKTTSAPELARICGGDSLPDIISSGPDMLIEFQTSAFDSLFHPTPVSYLLGFELQVEVIFVNANSQMYTRQPSQCEFTLSAFESTSGELDSPRHTLPTNTVCRYHFQGRRHEIVWITFAKYHSAVDQSIFEAPTECSPQLRIWDGKLRTNNKDDGLNENSRNASLMHEVCREEVPKLCSRLLISRETRPCSTHAESYLSTGPDLTIEFMPNPTGTPRLYGPSSAFKLRYEFLDTALGGAPLESKVGGPKAMPEPAALLQVQSKSCDRVYRSNVASRGIFRSPSNVFMFGRGGSANISCTIRFEANVDETVRLTITRARFGGRSCQNVQNRSGRWHCNYVGGAVADLRIGEVPWLDVPPLPRDCICADISGSLALAPIAASTVEAHFTALEMNIDQDFRDFYFEGRYEFVKDSCQINWEERRLHGISGEAFLGPSPCSGMPMIQPWLLEPETDNGYLVLMLKGFWMPTLLHSVPPCPTDARITVYSTNNPKESRDLCPSGADVVAFSDGWDSIHQFSPVEISKNLVIEFRVPWRPGAETTEYKISWMEVYPDTDCRHKCTELQACIAPKLWCDGKVHCPSGQDEDPSVCQAQPPLSPLHVGLAAALLTILLSLAAGLAACARRRRGEKKQTFHSDHDDMNSMQMGVDLNNSSGNASGGSGVSIDLTSKGYGNHHNHHHHHTHRSHRSSHAHALPPLYLDTQPKDNFC